VATDDRRLDEGVSAVHDVSPLDELTRMEDPTHNTLFEIFKFAPVLENINH